ncbi:MULTISPECIES: DUF938 domain-containing protein [unclassified Shewanella]|uniref:DUF938 domain-containing protein n=1 Tax=unclassified Shewanella TaxID=196818 RepID=UPI001BBA7B81|nr:MULTISPECIES: DUF938 domain-containing protein [unclassified Shewanella]GIU07713.1 methylase [Shewanella sp. MBTL60-112-B1]GIU30332.1 methylase [Shewanella sp. MBTL60-112-B2]
MSSLPYSQSCENNKSAIATVLEHSFGQVRHVLEVGSGTGQHAVHFAKLLPHLIWQTSDQLDYHNGINAWLEAEPSTNLRAPLVLDVTQPWPVAQLDAAELDGIFSANTLHIMSKGMVEAFFAGIGKHLAKGGHLCVYGPFNYNGEYTSDSNRNFDQWLLQQNPQSAIRDIEWISALAAAQGLELIADHPMPANNRLLHFEKKR